MADSRQGNVDLRLRVAIEKGGDPDGRRVPSPNTGQVGALDHVGLKGMAKLVKAARASSEDRAMIASRLANLPWMRKAVGL